LTQLHDKSHPSPSPSSKPTKELLTLSGKHHGIVDEEGLMMTTAMNPLSGPQNGLQNSPPDEEQEVAAASYRKT
jgi:hypothetical protein